MDGFSQSQIKSQTADSETSALDLSAENLVAKASNSKSSQTPGWARIARIVILASVSSAMLGAVVWSVIHQKDLFGVRAVPVEWTERMGSSRMATQLTTSVEASIGETLRGIMGEVPWRISLDEISAKLQENPWIREARVRRQFPDRVLVSITPRRPVAVLVERNGFRPLAEDGSLLPLWTGESVPDVPFLRSEVLLKDGARRAEAVEMLRELPEQGVLSVSNIAEIEFTRESGFSLVLISPRLEVLLGSGEIDTKLRRVSHVLNYLSQNSKRAAVIDATSSKKVVVRARQRP
ncbi:MAG TPA: FtsQ-type POTRA domain-containing protein [Pseudobdellovibrionaceae bacterium]|nr:FtsQ-type POTRA domain-containing protein [Pseudobdellovibrionaceae bacterium]